jgi:hypothetical protein
MKRVYPNIINKMIGEKDTKISAEKYLQNFGLHPGVIQNSEYKKLLAMAFLAKCMARKGPYRGFSLLFSKKLNKVMPTSFHF